MFWRRKREEPTAEPDAPAEALPAPLDAPPELDLDAPEPDAADFGPDSIIAQPDTLAADADSNALADADAPVVGLGATPTAGESASIPVVVSADGSEAAEEEALEHGLERTRGGFMSRLRGLLGGAAEGASWDDVEETLIAGDVGAALAMDIVEEARRRR